MQAGSDLSGGLGDESPATEWAELNSKSTFSGTMRDYQKP